jgi:LysR family transcriptional activator of dmlA
MKIDDVTTLRCFQSIYQTRNLTKSSEILGLSKAAVSKRLDALELELGFKLFQRTTRSITPTSEAGPLAVAVTEILEKIAGLSSRLASKQKSEKRKIRLTCGSAMAQRFLGKQLCEFQRLNPQVEIELIATDSVLDTTEANIDISIRVNPAEKSHLVGKKLGSLPLVAVASPSYWRAHFKKKNKKNESQSKDQAIGRISKGMFPKLKSIKDLVGHNLLLLEQHLVGLSLCPKETLLELKAQRKFITNDSPLLTQLTLQGYGVGIRTTWEVQEFLRKQELVCVLSEEHFRPVGQVWILSEADRLKSQIVRDLYEFMVENMMKIAEG